MSVGVELLDSDHKALVGLINRLHAALENREDPSVMDRVFENLTLYVERHFDREEQVMKACGYPELPHHEGEHRRFREDMKAMRERYFNSKEDGLGDDLLLYLKNWLNHHILIMDMAYKPFAQGNDLAERAAKEFGAGLSERQT
jgi:hemerythrin-like metal-binding protein